MSDPILLNLTKTVTFTPLLKGEVHLWTASLVVGADQVNRLRSELSTPEQEKASFYKFEAVQRRYIVSQAILKLLLAAYTGSEPSEIGYGYHTKGKPFLMNDASLFFNMSHSHEMCVYAFSRDAEVGIDIEMIRELPDLDQLINTNITPREMKYFQNGPEERLHRFFQFWTFKESYLKAIGEGMRLTPENLEFSMEQGGIIKLQSSNFGVDEEDWLFRCFTREGNYTGTLTYTGKDTVFKEMKVDLEAGLTLPGSS